MQLTNEQQAVHSFMHNPLGGHLLVSALAGSAKTTTIVSGLNSMPSDYRPSTLCVAFNKRIAVELEKKLSNDKITVKTLNALGHRAWGQYIKKRITLDTDKIYDLINEIWESPKYGKEATENQRTFEEKQGIKSAVNWARNYGWVPEKLKEIYPYAKNYSSFEEVHDIVEENESFSVNEEDVVEVLLLSVSAAYSGAIDFSDQIYMPVCFGGSWDRYDMVVVDEAQDLSELNHQMIRKSLSLKGRVIAVGDDHQSIYGFRGAASGSMEILRKSYDMSVLPLTLCFRCKSNIVLHVQKVVPEIRYWSENLGGAVEFPTGESSFWNPGEAKNDSAIICRNNAPLMAAAFKLIKANRSFKILGGDIGKGLIKLAKKFNQGSFEAWKTDLDAWLRKEKQKPKANKPRLKDKYDSFIALAEDMPEPKVIIQRLERIFNSTEGLITLTTGHKSKGFEYETVYFLDSHLINMTDEQDRNLSYVIQTRAINHLKYVNMNPPRSRREWDEEGE